MTDTHGESHALLHRCSPTAAPVVPGQAVERLPYRTIDVHCHLFTPAIEALSKDCPEKLAADAAMGAALGRASVEVNAARFPAILPKMTRAEERLRDMDAMGVDIQAVSPSPTQYSYWAPYDLAVEINRLQNDDISALCAAHPDRFIGLGTVSLQHPDLAAAQLDHMIRERGFKGVQIGSLANGLDVSNRAFDPFWRKADELGAVVFLHPWGTTLGDRLADHYLMNTLGQPLETAIGLSKLIFSGALDRHQRVKIIAAHGGGFLPLYSSRSDHAHAMRPEAGGCACRPSDYLHRIWYDTVVYAESHLRRLVEEVGASQVVVGTDYPFDMGSYDPSGLVRGLEPDVQRRILGANAAALFNLD